MKDNDNFSNEDPPVDGVPLLGAGACFKPPGDCFDVVRGVLVPRAVRAFTPAEQDWLDRLTYGPFGKPLKASARSMKDRSMDNVRKTIQIIELNGRANGCILPMDTLGEILRSNKTSERVIDCLIKGRVMESNKFYSWRNGIATRYKISLGFKLANTVHRIKEKLAANRELDAILDELE